MSDRFRAVALAIHAYMNSTYDLIAATDAVIALDTPASPHASRQYDHDVLVYVALGAGLVLDEVRNSKKITAIKELRAVTGCSLKAAKDAIEDSRVWDTYKDAWTMPHGDPWLVGKNDEPPF